MNSETMSEIAEWDSQRTEWVKVRDLVGKTFRLESVGSAKIRNKDSFVFRLEGGRAFSVNASDSTIGKQIARSGIPPTPAPYTILRKPAKNQRGYVFILKSVILQKTLTAMGLPALGRESATPTADDNGAENEI